MRPYGTRVLSYKYIFHVTRYYRRLSNSGRTRTTRCTRRVVALPRCGFWRVAAFSRFSPLLPTPKRTRKNRQGATRTQGAGHNRRERLRGSTHRRRFGRTHTLHYPPYTSPPPLPLSSFLLEWTRHLRSRLPSLSRATRTCVNACGRGWVACARVCVCPLACRTGLASALSPNSCIHYCSILGYAYAGLQEDVCQCGDTYGTEGPSTGCDTTCPGDLRQICGGAEAVSVWQVRILSAKSPPPLHTHT
eukprot:COSAG02_NODE_93_length_37477_cov_78.101129_26_plen_247_part_00